MELQLIQQQIHEIRGQKVMLDLDLAFLYEIDTKRLKEAVRRNFERFPKDFMFELTLEEARLLRSQIASLEVGRGKYSKYLPFAFTEQGVAMLSGILNSPKAIQTNIAIMRAFVAMRHFAWGYAELAPKLAEFEAKTGHEIADIHEALRAGWALKIRPARMKSKASKHPFCQMLTGKNGRESASKVEQKQAGPVELNRPAQFVFNSKFYF